VYALLSVFVVFLLLAVSEFCWHKRWFANDSELGRKFVHITVGSFVAFWPFFLSWNEIRLLSVAFLAVVVLSKQFKVFRAIHSVQRPTYGEICFALVVGALTFITHSKAIYAVSLLQMSLADGLAAVVGVRYGRNNTYHVWGHAKSVVGTLTFMVASLALFVGYSVYSTKGLAIGYVGLGAVAAALIENVAVLGLDNLIVPLCIGLLLTNL
jgi:phytol kinase